VFYETIFTMKTEFLKEMKMKKIEEN